MDFQVRSCAWCFFVEEFSNFQTNLFIILHKLSLFFRCHKSTAYHLGLYKDSYPSKANSCITYVLVFRDWQNIFLQLCPWYQRSYLKYVNIFYFKQCDRVWPDWTIFNSWSQISLQEYPKCFVTFDFYEKQTFWAKKLL